MAKQKVARLPQAELEFRLQEVIEAVSRLEGRFNDMESELKRLKLEFPPKQQPGGESWR